jgi:lysozyme
MTRQINQDGRNLIQSFEGYKSVAYPDPGTGDKPWTIGFGHTSGVTKGMSCNASQGQRWFTEDTAWAEDTVSSCVNVDLSDNEFASLVSFTFNVGANAFRQSSIVKAVNTRQFSKVPSLLLEYDHSAGKVLPGLLRRRQAEAALWSSPDKTISSRLAQGTFFIGTPTGISPADEPVEELPMPPFHATFSIPFLLSWPSWGTNKVATPVKPKEIPMATTPTPTTVIPPTGIDWIHMLSSLATVLFASVAAFDWTPFMSVPTAAKVTMFLGVAKTVFNMVTQGK